MKQYTDLKIPKRLRDCLAETDAINDVVVVELDSHMEIKGKFTESKLIALFPDLVKHISRLSKPFLNPEEGWTYLNLAFYDNGEGKPGQQWGEQHDVNLMLLAAAHFVMVQDNHKALGFKEESMLDLPGGVPYFAFNIEDDHLKAIVENMDIPVEVNTVVSFKEQA